MKPPPFEYLRPADLDGALAALAEGGEETRILAGGQSLIPMMNLRMVAPRLLVDINRIAGLDHIALDGDHLTIGALARHSDVLASPLVRQYAPLVTTAYPHIAHRPIRNRGTIGGNLMHADPASELPAVMLALDARMVLRRRGGERAIAAENFFVGAFETAARADELLTAIQIPLTAQNRRWGFEEMSQRQGDYALVAVAATFNLEGSLDGGVCRGARLACAGIANHALLLPAAAAALDGRRLDDDACAKVAVMAAQEVDPIEDIHADAAYRRDLVRALTRRALIAAARR
jgi:carbon-monoxide dehydrogenase medium subunit